ncbi:uncharacterized protein LOC111351189 [Spodoptera litura]|uniref:Uncharacterized protein LOC111351189 n=1 Tax=Spodoptera litura TaxID=69820 RepID=A0A9J7IMX6_SPOLT|nr:uncharacterized protein LOC111351189 [Spodoptera litura]
MTKKPVETPKPSTTKIIEKPKPKPVKKNKPPIKPKNKAPPVMKRGGNNKTQPQRRIIRKPLPRKMNLTTAPVKRRTPIRYKRISPGKAAAAKTIIKKNVVTHKPIEIKTTKHNLEMILAQRLMQKVMGKLRKSVAAELKNMSAIAIDMAKREQMKNLKKATAKQSGKLNQAKKNTKKNPVNKPMYKPGKPTKTTRNYIRNKRELNSVAISVIPINSTKEYFMAVPNVTVALPVTRMPSNLVVPDNDNSLNIVESSTLPENEYYKYFVGNEDHKIKGNVTLWDTGTTLVNITETVFDLIGAPLTSYASTEKGFIMSNNTRTITNFTEMNPEMNDLKHSKWAHLKILKEKKINALSDRHKSIVKLIAHNSRNRKINNRKYNIVKVVHRTSCMLKSCLSMNTTNSTAHKNSTEDLKYLLKKIMKDFNKTHVNATESTRKKKRKFSVLRYLKKIFNKLFKRDKPDRLSKHHLVETLCENFGPCRVSKRDRLKLSGKLGELDRETIQILKSVKIIKGLLKLVELPKSADADVSKQENLNDDVIKLNNILKGNFSFNLTDTQTTQVEYIKKNTEEFIASVRKFAKLLNEIISILNKHDVKVHKKFDLILTHKSNPKQNPFQSLRNLLIKYNLVQNSFMKQMYEQLNNFESNIHKNPKVSAVTGVNNSVEIENFSRNIIQNLRKLKRLAQTVSSNGRTKRELSRDDDAIEYLLMLMEYLIKQNHPLDAAPVNDGIDLLIEAIKNAPDIKPIKKKVLEYTPATYYETTTYPTTVPIMTENTFTEDDNPSDAEKSSSEDTRKMKLEEAEVKLDDNKEFVDMVADDDKDPEYNHYDRRAGSMKIDEVTEMSYFNRLEQNIAEPENFIGTTTPISMEMDSEKQDSQDDVNMEKTLTIEQNNLDKSVVAESRAKPKARARAGVETVEADAGAGVEMDVERAAEAAVAAEVGREGRVITASEARVADISDTNEKKFEVFAGDMDEESSTAAPITKSEPSTTVTTEFYSTQTVRSRTKMRHLNLESYDSESLDKKSKLEWIEENFGRDVPKDFTAFDENVNATAATIKPMTIKSIEAQVTDKLDVSNLTKEVAEEAEKNKKKTEKLNAEDVMLRKQMDLLNSLDYGTEKGELFESDSKDPNVEDRYSGDTFQSYFI